MATEASDCYQISDDDEVINGLEMGEDSLLEEMNSCPVGDDLSNSIVNTTDEQLSQDAYCERSSNGGYGRAWSTEATKALIHIRGPMEENFGEGRHRRSELWLRCSRQMHKLGYRYSAAKVQKKWHNILITYTKNLKRKIAMGGVNWEFFDDMFIYLDGKTLSFDNDTDKSIGNVEKSVTPVSQFTISDVHKDVSMKTSLKKKKFKRSLPAVVNSTSTLLLPQSSNSKRSKSMSITLDKLQPEVQLHTDEKTINDDDDDVADYNKPFVQKEECFKMNKPSASLTHLAGDTEWWKAYYERKERLEREKLQMQREMHHEKMQFHKLSMQKKEKTELIKIEAIQKLSAALLQLADAKGRKG